MLRYPCLLVVDDNISIKTELQVNTYMKCVNSCGLLICHGHVHHSTHP